MTTANTKEFKQTEVGEIPADWAVRTIGDLFNVLQGKALSGKARQGISPRPFLRTANVLWGKIDTTVVDSMDFDAEQVNRLNLQYGDLLSCEGGEIGRTAMWREEMPGCSFQNHIHRLRVKDIEEVVPLYVMYWLQAAFLHLKIYGGVENKTTIPNISKSRLMQLPVALPLKTEQERIAGLLSKLQKTMDTQEKIVAGLRELKASTVAKLFREGLQGEPLKNAEVGEMPRSWQAAPLSAVCADTSTLNPGKYPDKIIEYVDVSSVSREECRIISSTRYKGKDAPGRARNLVKHRDVIFATVRPTLRRVALIPKDFDGQLVSTAFCVIRAIEPKAYPEYLYYVVSSPTFIAQVGRLERGANYPAVTDTNVLSQKIPLPGYDEQKEIASELMKIDKALSSNAEKAKHLSDLFTVTLNQLMTGKVRM